jgi:hypothetical protein
MSGAQTATIAAPEEIEFLDEPVYYYSNMPSNAVVTPGGLRAEFSDHILLTVVKPFVDYLDGEIARRSEIFRRCTQEEIVRFRERTIPQAVRETELRQQIEAQVRAEYEARERERLLAESLSARSSSAMNDIVRDPGAAAAEAQYAEERVVQEAEAAERAAAEKLEADAAAAAAAENALSVQDRLKALASNNAPLVEKE